MKDNFVRGKWMGNGKGRRRQACGDKSSRRDERDRERGEERETERQEEKQGEKERKMGCGLAPLKGYVVNVNRWGT